ncbi:hypothetical protein N599_04215 [Saccharopolyspora erythraea D]|nr:hypothetical protein N599_04215 [Saccharopolyspora erythraea D]
MSSRPASAAAEHGTSVGAGDGLTTGGGVLAAGGWVRGGTLMAWSA